MQTPRDHIERRRVAVPKRRRIAAFTLIELLVVIAIIGILASITMPALKGFGKGTVIKGAQRQLLDDLGLARLTAIGERTTVYMLFVPPEIGLEMAAEDPREVHFQDFVNVFDQQYTSYALFTERGVGAQPGRLNPKYLTEWRSLPEGMMFAPYKIKGFLQPLDFPPQWMFQQLGAEYTRPLPRRQIHFPAGEHVTKVITVPYIAFNSQGQLTTGQDIILPIAEGGVIYERDANGNLLFNRPADYTLTPNYNYTNNFIRINWLTGRAKIERPETF